MIDMQWFFIQLNCFWWVLCLWKVMLAVEIMTVKNHYIHAT